MKILVINGPNMNLLGKREPAIYGTQTYNHLTDMIEDYCDDRDIDVDFVQSNHEGAIVDAIHKAYFDKYNGIIINPAAYTHTSVAILDALRAVAIPAVEVHISNIDAREEFRKYSYTSSACIKTIVGKGFSGYIEAVDVLRAHYNR